MKIQSLISVALLLLTTLIFSGCMTPVSVQTDPPGATVYCRGSGRPAYKWKPRGITAPGKPVTFRVPYNAIQTFAYWPTPDGKSGVRSEIVKTKLLFEDDANILIKR